MKATYTKLKDGSWGVRVEGITKPEGNITVTKKDGTSKEETIKTVVWSGNGVYLCSIVPTSNARPSYVRGYQPARKWCRCQRPLDEGDGECMYCGYQIR